MRIPVHFSKFRFLILNLFQILQEEFLLLFGFGLFPSPHMNKNTIEKFSEYDCRSRTQILSHIRI